MINSHLLAGLAGALLLNAVIFAKQGDTYSAVIAAGAALCAAALAYIFASGSK